MKVSFILNDQEINADVSAQSKLLWFLREELNLTGTKYGCGIAQCGVCTVLVDDSPVKACITPVVSLNGKDVRTIEGLSIDGSHPLQQAWVEHQVPQCGYCQSGQIMQANALLKNNPNPTLREIKEGMSPVLCRCGTYHRINQAIMKVTKS